MNLFKYPANKRFTISRSRNRIFIGLTTLGLSLGIIGTLSSHSVIQTFSKTPLTKAFNKGLLTSNSQGLRTTVDPVTLGVIFGGIGAGAGIIGVGITSAQFDHSKKSSQQQAKQLEEMNKRLDDMGKRLENIEKDTKEIRGLIQKGNEIEQGTQKILNKILDALTNPKSPAVKTKKKTGGSSRTRKRG